MQFSPAYSLIIKQLQTGTGPQMNPCVKKQGSSWTFARMHACMHTVLGAPQSRQTVACHLLVQ